MRSVVRVGVGGVSVCVDVPSQILPGVQRDWTLDVVGWKLARCCGVWRFRCAGCFVCCGGSGLVVLGRLGEFLGRGGGLRVLGRAWRADGGVEVATGAWDALHGGVAGGAGVLREWRLPGLSAPGGISR